MELHHVGELFTMGSTVSIEERAVLEVQMTKKQIDEKLHSMRFWGRVTGTTRDYLVVCGVVSTSEFPTRKYFYAVGPDLALQQFPELTPEFTSAAEALASGRFLGNPAKLLGPDADAGEEEEELDEEGNAKPRKPRFSEAHRLAYVVGVIEGECGAVPKGAYAVTATRHVVPNPAFGGLSPTDATNLSSWSHFRVPRHPSRATALTRAAAVPGSDDFLDALVEDEPKGVWASTLDAARGVARVASLKYPGYYAFATTDGTAKWGAVYFGDGRPVEIHIML